MFAFSFLCSFRDLQIGDLQIGDLVAVALESSNRKSKSASFWIYMAEVVEVMVDDDAVEVKYMKKRGHNLYVWPNDAQIEYSSESMDSIKYKLSSPQRNTSHQYQFDSNELGNLVRTLTTSDVQFQFK